MKRIVFVISFLFSLFLQTGIAEGQSLKLFEPTKSGAKKPEKSKQNLATEYYVSGDYAKALPLFEDLYQSSNSSYHYRYLLYCYVNLGEYKKAETLIKKANKDKSRTHKKLADLGYLQLQIGNVEKSEKLFDQSIEELPADKGAVNDLANDFRSRGQTDWAEKAYFKGKKLLKNEYGFESELAYLYYYLGKYDQMSDAYLDLLEKDPNQMRIVQYRIQSANRKSSEEDIYPYLKDKLIERINKSDESGIYSELLLWLSIQKQDFRIAIIQAKALDKKDGGEYFRTFDLAKVMLNNSDYEGSIQAFDFILSRSGARDLVIYPEVKQYVLAAKFGQLKSRKNPEPKDIDHLANEYTQTLNELGKFRFTIPTIIDYSKLLFNYQIKKEQAIEELESILENQGLSNADRAPIKLLLGDFYLMTDNPWEATLLYSQVEKDFKNDEYGFESRLKNAKLSFYIGEFEWSKAQLDILKAATDRKIANDAMNMSLLISENLDADSNTRALELYGKADLLLLQEKDSLALVYLDSIFMISLFHELHDNVWLKKAEIYASNLEYDASRSFLLKILENKSDGLLADDAVWMMARQFEHYDQSSDTVFFNKYNTAKDLYKKILTDYPSSIYVNDARKRYRSTDIESDENKNAESL